MHQPIQIVRQLMLALSLLCAATPAFAIITAGRDSHCLAHSIQSAIDAVLNAERGGDFTDPFIAVAAGPYNEELSINATGISDPRNGQQGQGAFIQIEGGFNTDCTRPLQPLASNVVTVDTGGRDGASVVTVRGNARVLLLTLSLAGAVVLNHGGGIDFDGSGLLDLKAVDISGNHGGFGAGIYANGQAPLKVILHSETIIEGNVASHSGGGIYISGQTYLTALEPQTLIFNNTASAGDSNGTGGGLEVNGGPAVADIGSPGYRFADGSADPVIFFNHARRGGGAAAENNGRVRLLSSVVGQPGRIEGNDAVLGGGVYAGGGNSAGRFCGFGYGINGNTASDGAAIYVDASSGVDDRSQEIDLERNSFCNLGTLSTPNLPPHDNCAAGTERCNTIDGNTATGSGGAIVHVAGNRYAFIERLQMRHNSAAVLWQNDFDSVHTAAVPSSTLSNCLFANNQVTSALLSIANEAFVESCTFADNTIGAAGAVVRKSGALRKLLLDNSILSFATDQGQKALVFSAGTFQGTDLISSETDSLLASDLSSNVSAVDPEFIDAANGNYHLKPTSPAIDRTVRTFRSDESDLAGSPRPVALFDPSTPQDLGAFELQSAPPCSYFEQVFCNDFE